MSRTKTEYMVFRFGEEEVGDEGVLLGGDLVPKKDSFKYMRYVMQSDGGVDMNVKHRIQVGWNK